MIWREPECFLCEFESLSSSLSFGPELPLVWLTLRLSESRLQREYPQIPAPITIIVTPSPIATGGAITAVAPNDWIRAAIEPKIS